MLTLFISLRFLDVLDILLVATLLYHFYKLIKGTVAINISAGIFSLYLIWLIVRALNMQLLSSILGQFIGVGMIALIIVFQQEIRKFLLLLGTKYFKSGKFSLNALLFNSDKQDKSEIVDIIIDACKSMSKTRTGVLLVISKDALLRTYTQTGEIVNARISKRLLENIFFKNSPLHDGAVIIVENEIKAAACVLPLTTKSSLPKNLGLRHRSALGMSEETNALVIIVSEETGAFSYAQNNELHPHVSIEQLREQIGKEVDS